MSETKKQAADWELIEREYRAGQLSEAQIARQFGISRAAIQKRAKKNGWSRDLSEHVRREVSARLVAEGLQGARTTATIEAAADRAVQLVREHRKDIKGLRAIVTKLIELLEEGDDLVEASVNIEDDKLRKRIAAALGMTNQAALVASLSNTLKTLIPLEREAFALDSKPESEAIGTVDISEASLAKIARFLG